MSLLVTVVVNDAIIMASDSRTTYCDSNGNVTYSDHANKTYLMDERIGISTCRNATVNGEVIEEHLKKFEMIYKNRALSRIPRLLQEYFLQLNNNCDIGFFVCGYENGHPHVYRVFTQGGIEKCPTPGPVSYWEGERDVPSRLFSTVFVRNGYGYIPHGEYQLKINEFSILDGVEYAKFIINTAKGAMKFQYTNQTIGGAIDVLVLKQNGSFWYEKK
jgi:hypothetical protein